MKKFIYITLLATMLCSCTPSDVLDKVPDLQFQEYLFYEFDVNNDGKVEKREYLAVKEMTPDYSYKFKSVKGIEYFSNLESFSFNGHNPEGSVYDFSKSTSLKRIHLMNNNNLVSIQTNKNIEGLYLIRTAIKELEVTNRPNLKVLSIDETDGVGTVVQRNSKLEKLTLSNLPNLKQLYLQTNQIDYVDVSEFKELTKLWVYNMPELDISENQMLSFLKCKGTKILWMKQGQVVEGVNVNPDYKYSIDSDLEIKYK